MPSSAARSALIRDAYDHHLVALWELRDDRLVPRAVADADATRPERLVDRPRTFGVLGEALGAAAAGDEVATAIADREDGTPADPAGRPAGARRGDRRPGRAVGRAPSRGRDAVVARRRWPPRSRRSSPGPSATMVAAAHARTPSAVSSTGPRRSTACRATSAAGSTSTGSSPGSSTTPWSCSRPTAAPSSCASPTARSPPPISRGLSASFLSSVRDFPAHSLPAEAVAQRRPLFAVDYRDDPRGRGVRAAVVQEGFDTICTAPLFDGASLLGLLNVYHDQPHPWIGRRPRDHGRPGDPGQRRDPGRPGLRAHGDLGRPAAVDPAARDAAEPPVRRPGDRHGHRDRAPPAHRLPQRPGLPAGRRRPRSRSR